MVGIFLPSSKHGKVQLVTKNSPFRWKRGWSWPCFDKTLPSLLCKCCSHANKYFLSKIYIRKGRRFVSNKVNLTFTQRLRHLKPTTVKWPIRRGIEANEKYFEWIILRLSLSVARIHQRFYFVYLPCLVEAEIKLVLNLLIPYNSSQSKTNLNIFFFWIAPIIEVGCNQYCAKPPHCPPGNNVCRTSICPPGTQCVACPCDCVNVLCIHWCMIDSKVKCCYPTFGLFGRQQVDFR